MSQEQVFSAPEAHSGLLDNRITTKMATVYGLGHLGSWIALGLAKLGMKNIALFDYDSVEERNISGSVYTVDDISDTKVGALKDTIVKETGPAWSYVNSWGLVYGDAVKSFSVRDTRSPQLGYHYQPLSDFYILAVDGAHTRKMIAEGIFRTWDVWGKSVFFRNMNPIIIDVRSGGPRLTVLNLPIVDKDVRKRYFMELDRLEGYPTRITCNTSNIFQVPMAVTSYTMQIISSFCRGVEEYKMWHGSLLDLDVETFSQSLYEYLPTEKEDEEEDTK